MQNFQYFLTIFRRLLSGTSMSTDTNPTQRRPAGTLGHSGRATHDSAPPKIGKSDQPMTRDELSHRFVDDEWVFVFAKSSFENNPTRRRSLWDSDVSDTERAPTLPGEFSFLYFHKIYSFSKFDSN